MHIVIAGGTGLIGQSLVDHWLGNNHQITVIGRTREGIEKAFAKRVRAVTWQSLNPDILGTADLVINLAGASVGDERWTPERKQEILDSRIEITKRLANEMMSLGPTAPPLMNASGIGIYGLQKKRKDGLPPPLTEDMAGADDKSDFMSEVAHKWEAAARPFIQEGGRVIFLRFGVVLSNKGGALPQMIKPFKFGVGGPIGDGRQPFSWISIDDVIRVFDFLKADPDASGPFNVVAPGAVTQKMFAKAVGKVLHRPSFIPLPAFVVKAIFGQMGEELLLSGQHVVPSRLIEKRFQFKFPTIDQALEHLLQ